MKYIESEEKLFRTLKIWKNAIVKKNLEANCSDERDTEELLITPFLRRLKWKIEPKKMELQYPAGPDGKGGEKVDYALFRDWSPFLHPHPWLVIEAKKAGEEMPLEAPKQLIRYAVNTRARYACWTNGINWIWYKNVRYLDNKEKLTKEPKKNSLEEFLSHDVMKPQKSEVRSLLAMSQCIELSAEEINRIVDEKIVLNLFEDWSRDPDKEVLKEVRKSMGLAGSDKCLEMVKKAWSKRVVRDTDTNPHKDTGKNSHSTPKPKPQPGKPKPKRKELLLQVMSKDEWLTIDELIKKVREEYGIEIPKNTVSKYRSDLKTEKIIEIDREKGARLL